MSLVNAAAATSYHASGRADPNPPASRTPGPQLMSKVVQDMVHMLAQVTRSDVAVLGDLLINGRDHAASTFPMARAD